VENASVAHLQVEQKAGSDSRRDDRQKVQHRALREQPESVRINKQEERNYDSYRNADLAQLHKHSAG
jgi:hypothetical protein